MADDPYVDPRTNVLTNLLGITDEDELRSAEADISAAALFRLHRLPHLGEGHFDLGHLRDVHRLVFGEVYPWAGAIRVVDIAKGAPFCPARNIEAYAATVFEGLARDNFLVGLDRPDLVREVGTLYGALNALHPFREGNGRAQRAFLSALGVAGGWRLRWADLDAATNDEANRRSLVAGDDSALVEIVDTLLEESPVTLPRRDRRPILYAPEVAARLPRVAEALRRGPDPSLVSCGRCGSRYPLATVSTVVLFEADRGGVVTFEHARCGRSRVRGTSPPSPAAP